MALVKYNNNSISAITAAAGLASGAMTLISTTTASSDSTLSITSGIDSTYPIYLFKFINIHPSADSSDLGFQVDTGTNTNYNLSITSTAFQIGHAEDDSENPFGYETSDDQANGTGFQMITQTNAGNANDESSSGEMFLFNPSSTTFVKHFMSRLNTTWSANGTFEKYAAGYINNTAAVTRIQFKMNTGNIDSGLIKLYGIKDS
jgi:hypothetical protein|tara:strand:- start:353 stop:964 length:612 start_codon:yes stop_codon:yes gene_type:complete